jgi:hypothetical protein
MKKKQTILQFILLIMGAGAFLMIPITLPAKLGTVDFRPYWSSSFLLARRQDFSDAAKMDNIERTLTGWTEPYTMYAWFAPTGNLILLPYTLFPFGRAAYYWLVTNIVVVFINALLIWRNTKTHTWIPLAAAFGFSATLLSLAMGQINTMVILGLALFLFFSKSKNEFAAGASLVLVTIKPHLVILTLPLLILDVLRRKQWRILAGFAGALAGCALILFFFYPAWIVGFWKMTTFGMSTIRATPTLTGLLVIAGEYKFGKWIWVMGLLTAIFFWWKNGKEWDQRTLIDVSIMAGLFISPIGWSYDQVMLLFPILHILEWLAKSSFKGKNAIILATLIAADAVTFYQRTLTLSEVWFFWVPLVIAGIYFFARRNHYTPQPHELPT